MYFLRIVIVKFVLSLNLVTNLNANLDRTIVNAGTHLNSVSDKLSNASDSLNESLKSYVPEVSDCDRNDEQCLTTVSNDRLGYEAIRTLHKQLDDDANGDVDLSESNDFLREELKYDSGYEKRQKVFHQNNDMHISVEELWLLWLQSEVHNWTVDQTIDWLQYHVGLPQYSKQFADNKITGALLPRLAVNNLNFLSNQLGIKDPIHRQKIALKAMDVVLFGPPKDAQKYWKDLVLVTLLFGSIIGAYYAYVQNKKSKLHLARMISEMESLQRAEQALQQLQKELEEAKLAKDNVANEKETLEQKLLDSGTVITNATNANTITGSISDSDLELSHLRAEVEMLRNELKLAEGELKDKCWSVPIGLQHWLQLTHEYENKAYLKKRAKAEKQLQNAREACEKLKKKRSSFVGAFVSTHGKNIDDLDRTIMEARTALNEVTVELRERVYRWKQIEQLCGFPIINNKGVAFLENLLYRNEPSGKFGIGSRIGATGNNNNANGAGRMDSSTNTNSASGSGQIDDNEDDTCSIYSQAFSISEKPMMSKLMKESFESSSSGETVSQIKHESDNTIDDNASIISSENVSIPKLQARIKPKPPMIRSRSQDIQLPASFIYDDWTQIPMIYDTTRLMSTGKFMLKGISSNSINEETNSTDSSSLNNDESGNKKSKKSKLSSLTKKLKPKLN